MTAGWQRLIPLLAVLVTVGSGGAAGRELPLVDAARNADREAVRALLKQGASVNAADARRYDRPPLGQLPG